MRTRLVARVGGLAVACLAVGAVAFAADPTIKDIMDRAHKGANSLLSNIGKDLKADEPEWGDIKKETEELVTLGAALGKNKPPRDQASWDRLTKQYYENATALDAAVANKNKGTAQTLQKALTMSCMDCHKAHRPMKGS